MHNDDDVKDTQTKPDDPPTDAEGIDETFTPSSNRTKEQALEKFEEKIAEIERHVADGN